MTTRERYKQVMTDLMEAKPEAKLVENRYRVMRYVLRKYIPQLETLKDSEIEDICRDVVYLDRQIRILTEDTEREKKEILSQEYQIKELGREVGYHGNVKKLGTVNA